MHFVFLSSVCSSKEYERIVSRRKIQSIDSSQFFYSMFLKELANNPNNSVDVVSFRPVSSSTYDGILLKGVLDFENGIRYHHLKSLNIPLLQSVFAKHSAKRLLKRIITKDSIIICDGLNLAAMKSIKKYLHTNLCSCFLTDLPCFSTEQDKMSSFKRFLYLSYNKKATSFIKLFKKHIVLTDAMANYLKIDNYLVVECFSSKNDYAVLDCKKKFNRSKTVVYAGKLHKEFGLDVLLDSLKFVKSKFELQLYGEGNFTDCIKQACKIDERIKYMGLVSNNEMKIIEANAFVVVNPRQSSGEFTKYSFPSKTAEYLSSGTPLIMFKLPGVPDNYFDYVIRPKEETALSLGETIDYVLNLSIEEYSSISKAGLDFISSKDVSIQVSKIVKFLLN